VLEDVGSSEKDEDGRGHSGELRDRRGDLQIKKASYDGNGRSGLKRILDEKVFFGFIGALRLTGK
jgi:hypothetical protein